MTDEFDEAKAMQTITRQGDEIRAYKRNIKILEIELLKAQRIVTTMAKIFLLTNEVYIEKVIKGIEPDIANLQAWALMSQSQGGITGTIEREIDTPQREEAKRNNTGEEKITRGKLRQIVAENAKEFLDIAKAYKALRVKI